MTRDVALLCEKVGHAGGDSVRRTIHDETSDHPANSGHGTIVDFTVFIAIASLTA